MNFSRILATGLLSLGIGLLSMPAMAQAQNNGAAVKWLESAPPTTAPVSWGVPWPKGTVQKDQTFALTGADGKSLPLQSWTMAYWPDGSIKWTGFATVAGADAPGDLRVTPGGNAAAPTSAVKVSDAANGIDIDTGSIKAHIAKSGANLFDTLSIDGKEVAKNARLECIVQSEPDADVLKPPARELYTSNISKVTVEQSGPVRAVVKIEGTHKAASGSRQWLPFVVRLYFSAGSAPIKMVHTIIYDGDQQKDFIRGLDVTFDVPLREEPQNRHVRFGNTNGGLFAEPLLLAGFGGGRGGRGGRGGGGGNQLDGAPANGGGEAARWDAFKLVQLNSEGFVIYKRTNPNSSWLYTAEGHRASGYGYVGDTSGGLGVGNKDFWQAFPSEIEITNALTDTAQLRMWLWSPEGPAMDMRHYDTHGHGNVNSGGSYEDYEAGYDDPSGVARTSELTLFPVAATPTRAEAVAQAQVASQPPLLTVAPEYLHSTNIFGPWAVQDRSTPFKQDVEDRLDAAIKYYQGAIDQHHWYGYWNFGDVRHAYDANRHVWRYDVGGYAWDNTELGSVLWLWYSYIRTGRADIFRMAEAMIRHTSEVDTYHLGKFAGLGSRHNVSHWGDSAKEPRVSQAAHARFYYYLTTDERTGDILKEVVNVDKITSQLDMMRKAQPKNEQEQKYPGRIRVGPDWLAFVGNWMTEWERTGDTKWRDKIMAGVNSMYEMPYWMRSGQNLVMGYDPETGKLYQVSQQAGTYNLPTIQGGAEVAFELTDLLNEPKWEKMWLQYCRLGRAPADVLTRDKETGTEGADASMMGENGANSQGTARLAAWVYSRTKNKAFADRAIRMMGYGNPNYTPRKIDGPESLNPVDEAPGVSTNTTAQSSLMDIEILELCKDVLPTQPLPPEEPRGGFGGGRGRGRGGAGRGAAPARGGNERGNAAQQQ
jgi:hypothetical protein